MSLLLNIEFIDGNGFFPRRGIVDNRDWYLLKTKSLTCEALYLNNQSIGDEKN